MYVIVIEFSVVVDWEVDKLVAIYLDVKVDVRDINVTEAYPRAGAIDDFLLQLASDPEPPE